MKPRSVIYLIYLAALLGFGWTIVSCKDRGALDGKSPEGMVPVPSGRFIMGSDKVDTEGTGARIGLIRPMYLDEHPRRKPFLPGFYIDRYEVTNAAYKRFTDQTGYRPPQLWEKGMIPDGKAYHPVAFVSWYEAEQYCRWAGKRLPTEMEWEKAARGPEGLEYPWGNQFESGRGNTGDMDLNDTTPVGRFEQGLSPYGVYDLSGNIAEWTGDWYEPYPGNSYSSPLFGKRFKVLRGGSWGGGGGHYAMGFFYRSAHRLFANPLDQFPDTGFRCVKPA